MAKYNFDKKKTLENVDKMVKNICEEKINEISDKIYKEKIDRFTDSNKDSVLFQEKFKNKDKELTLIAVSENQATDKIKDLLTVKLFDEGNGGSRVGFAMEPELYSILNAKQKIKLSELIHDIAEVLGEACYLDFLT